MSSAVQSAMHSWAFLPRPGRETHGDIFIFLSQCSDKYLPGVEILKQEQLDWLKAQFDAYRGKRIYLTSFGPDGEEGTEDDITNLDKKSKK